LNPNLPVEVERITNKLLEKDRKLRYQSASDMGVDLKRLRREIDSGRIRAGSVYTTAATVATAARPSSWPNLMAILAAALLAAVVLAYILRSTLPAPKIIGFTKITHDGQQKSFAAQVAATVLTDGTRLYIQENFEGRFVVSQVSASGGETVPMPMPFPNVALDNISADKLVVGSFTGAQVEQPLWAVPVLGGSPRRLGDLPGDDAIWMANGDLLIARSNELTVLSSGGSPRKFASIGDASFMYWLRWSPHGRVLRFSVSDPSGNSIWEVNADGSRLHRLLSTWHAGTDPGHGNWTPDGKYFLFQAFHNGRGDIWAIRETGGLLHRVSHEPEQLTAGPLSFLSPQPSLDGKKIFVIGEQPRAELVRYDAKFGQFVPYLGGISAMGVSFSRDGQWVSYVSYPEGDLWRCRVDGSERLQLTSAPFFVNSAEWSPDGRRIAFSAAQPGKAEQLYLVATDGGTPHELSVGELGVDRVSWAPDGGSIDFFDVASPEKHFIRSVDLKTLKVYTLPDSEKWGAPVRSPDGRYLVASSVDGQQLMLFDFATQKWSELATISIGFTQWSADSKYVYFDTGASAEPAINRIRISNHQMQRVASLKGLRRVVTPWVSWSGLTPDGSPLLMRDTGTQEVYALDFEAP
jgi:Tol biopolymer transport system component